MATETQRRLRLLVASPREREALRRSSEDRRFGALVEALERGGFAVERATPEGPEELREAARVFAPNLVFSSFFRFPELPEGEGRVEALVDELGACWIGSPTAVMEAALSKPLLKSRWRSQGIPTPDWLVARLLPDGSVDGLSELACLRDFPYIVKPAREGNSRGIDDASVVGSLAELRARVESVARTYSEVLVERFVSGGEGSREFTVAMIGNGPDALVCAIEIVKTGPSPVISEEDKERQTTKLLPLADEGLRGKVEGLARKVFLIAGARDYARCDLLLHEGRLYAIEMNGQPMVPDRWFAACSREAGLDEVQYPNAIVLAAMAKSEGTGRARLTPPKEAGTILPPSILRRLARGGGGGWEFD